ncbi:MAG: addiction module HigA family antidote [Phenylobacterium sp.]|jgi:addiction module HigA family antidote
MSIDINDIGKMDFSDISTGKEAPVHPGEVLKEDYLVPLNITANALALAIRVPPSRISAIINGKRSITPETALRLAQYFGGDPVTWMNLQVHYDLTVAEQSFGEQIRLEVLTPKSTEHVEMV